MAPLKSATHNFEIHIFMTPFLRIMIIAGLWHIATALANLVTGYILQVKVISGTGYILQVRERFRNYFHLKFVSVMFVDTFK